MKRVLSCIVLLCFILSSLGLVTLAEGEKVYRVEGKFTGAGAEAPVSIFVLKDGYTMEDLASSSGSVLDKVYYTNIFEKETDSGGAYSFDISVPSEALDAQCVLSCNGQIKQDLLRRFLTSYGDFKVLYAAPSAASSPDGTEAKPYSVGTALVNKLKTETANGYDVDIRLKGGRYSFQNWRLQMIDVNVNGNGSMTFLPATKDDEVLFTSTRKIPHSYINKVTDEEILSKVPEIARGSVYEIDALGSGSRSSVLTMNYSGASAERPSIQPPVLYYNGKAQRMSQYPNEGNITVNQASCTGTDSSGNQTISLNYDDFADIDISKWADSFENAYLTGFLLDSYRAIAAKILAVDTTNKKLSVDCVEDLFYSTSGAWYSGYSYYGPRITIVNLLEEMDIPGEYYFDQDTQKIYYFAPEEITEDDVFELADDSDTYPNTIFIQRVKNLTFQDIEFFGSRFDNIIYVSCADNIRFIDCDLHGAARRAISAVNVTNLLVEGCNIYDTGTNGVSMNGGVHASQTAWGINVQTSAASTVNSNNIVRNNHVYNFSQNPTLGSDGQGISIDRGSSSKSKSLGDKIENNLIHGSKFIGAVRYGGLRLSVARNEMYNVLDSVDDAGVVYSGRTFNEFGNTISENYIHDFNIISPARYANMAIYWDDHISGQTAERNIIVSANPNRSTVLGIRTIGYDNEMRGNILVDTYYGIRFAVRSSVAFADSNGDDHNLYSSLSGLPASDYERYQDMVDFKAAINATGSTKKMVYGALAEKNVLVNNNTPVSLQATGSNATQGYLKSKVSVGNVETTSTSIFVNPADKNYVIKAANATAGTAYAAAPNANDFDMDLIGTQKEVPFVDHEFKLLYPANESYLTEDNLVLTWEQANFSDRYDYVIAKDSSFKTIVEEGSTKNNFIIPTENYADGTYYWKVTATNESRDMGRTWSSEEAYQTFTIGEEMDIEIIANEVATTGGTRLENLKGQTEFKVNYTVRNNASESKDYVVFAAIFTPEGDFVQAKVDTPEKAVASKATASGTFNFTPSETVAAAADGYYIKTFVFESLKSITPLSFFDEALKK